MRHRSGAPLLPRQPRLRAIERLNLALLVDAQKQRIFRRIPVQPHPIAPLLHAVRIVAQLAGLHQMRLQTVRVPEALHGIFTAL